MYHTAILECQIVTELHSIHLRITLPFLYQLAIPLTLAVA